MLNDDSTHTMAEPKQVADGVRPIMENFLQQFGVSYKVLPLDQQFHDKCLSQARESGYPVGTDPDQPSILPFLPIGAAIGSITYAHVESEPCQIFIALYSTLILYLDDLFQRDVEKVYRFTERFVHHQKHDHPILDSIAHLLGTANTHYNHIASNMIVTETLNYVTSLLLDHETQGIKRSNHASSYPQFIRMLSGLPSAYIMFIFPPHIPLQSYVQAFPEMSAVLCYINDVMSFYKEELRGESENYISIAAESSGLSKLEVLKKLSDDVATADSKILQILKDDPQASDAYIKCRNGFILFHISCARYKLDHLLGRV